MGPKARLFLCGVMIVISALYAALIAVDTQVASAVALGYIALLLTAYFFATTILGRR